MGGGAPKFLPLDTCHLQMGFYENLVLGGEEINWVNNREEFTCTWDERSLCGEE